MNGNDDEAAALRRRTLVLILVCTAQFMCVLDDTIVNVALPSIQRGLGFSEAGLPWAVNGYLVTFGGLLLLAGRACDLFVRRTVFVTGLVLFGVASLTCGLAGSPLALIVSRAVQGAGAAAMSAAALAILTATFSGAERHRAFGVWGGLSGVAGALGMLLGGALTSALSWRWVFLINVPIVLAVVVASLRFVPDTRSARRSPLDPFGAITITAGLGLLIVGIVRSEQNGWTSPITVICLAGAAVLVAAFVWIEARHRAPLLPLGVFRRRTVTGGVVGGILLAAAMLGLFYFLTLYLQRVLGYSALECGLAYLPMSVTVVMAAGLTSRLITRFGLGPPLIVGFALIAGALVWFARIGVGSGYLPDLLGPAVVAGAGLGATLVGVVTAATHDLDGASGLASGLVGTTQQMGGALGVAVLSTIATARSGVVVPVTPAALTEGYRLAFHTGAGVAAAGVVVGLLVAVGPAGPALSGRPAPESRDGRSRRPRRRPR